MTTKHMPREPKMGIDKPPTTEQGPVSLRSLLTYDNPNAELYRRLSKERVEEYGKTDLHQEFSLVWTDTLGGLVEPIIDKQPLKDYLAGHLSGHLLIDLGCGRADAIRYMARTFHAKGYIGVDINYGLGFGTTGTGELDPFKAFPAPKELGSGSLPKVKTEPHATELMVRADILDFISRLPENSANISINGMDESILPYFDDRDIEYRKALRYEMQRILPVGGVIFGNETDVLGFTNESKMKPKHPEMNLVVYPKIEIFEKIS